MQEWTSRLPRRLLISGLAAFFLAAAPAGPAGAACDEASYDAAADACDDNPPAADCAQKSQAVQSACQNEMQSKIQALDSAKPEERDKAVKELRDLQRRIYYRMADLKSYGFLGQSGGALPGFKEFANSSWYRMDNVITKHGFEATPNGDDEEEPPEEEKTQGSGGSARHGKGSGGETPSSKEAAEKLLTGGDPAKAERMLDKLIEADPDNPDLLATRAVARLNQDKNDGALRDAKDALALDPQNKLARQVSDFITLSGQAKDTGVKLRKPDFGGKKDLASAFDGGSGRAAATGMLGGQASRSGAQASGGSSDGVSASGGWVSSGKGPGDGAYAPAAQMTLPLSQGLTASQMSVQEAQKKLRLGDVSGALLDATRAIQADPGNARAWGTRAAVQNKLKNYDAAISDATEALKLDPKNVPALLERGFAQYNLSNYSAALADIGEALALEPMNALAYLYRGMIFEKMHRYTEALSDYEMAARLDPTLRAFWESAKKRLLGGKKGGAGAAGQGGGRGTLWAAAAGPALCVFLVVWWKRRRARLSRALAEELDESAAEQDEAVSASKAGPSIPEDSAPAGIPPPVSPGPGSPDGPAQAASPPKASGPGGPPSPAEG